MKATNTMNAAAYAAGYGLAVARAVERSKAVLRQAQHSLPIAPDQLPAKDAKTLIVAGLIYRGYGQPRPAYILTDTGRALASKL